MLQLEMERLSLSKAAPSDRAAAARLTALDSELQKLKEEQVGGGGGAPCALLGSRPQAPSAHPPQPIHSAPANAFDTK